MNENYNLIISLISLGFFGGFSHCTSMCGPFVLTQIGNRLEKRSIAQFSNFKKLQDLALLPYHLGRITTYSLIGFFSSLITQNLQEIIGFKILSIIFLFLAILFFLNIFFENKFTFKIKTLKKYSLSKFFNFTKFSSNLFKNPTGLRGYCLGLLLGFLPCGLLYGAFLIAAAMPSPLMAAIGMTLFGISTFPALFLSGVGSYAFFKFEIAKLQLLFKITALINIIMILLMIYKMIYYV
jgi:sulfite exporter TauE/SafE